MNISKIVTSTIPLNICTNINITKSKDTKVKIDIIKNTTKTTIIAINKIMTITINIDIPIIIITNMSVTIN